MTISDTFKPAAVLTPKELRQTQRCWAGRRIHIDFEHGVDGPRTAARLLIQTFQAAGAIILPTDLGAEAIVQIGACAAPMRFWFSVQSAKDPAAGVREECDPRALTAAIMAAVSNLFDPALENALGDESSREHTALIAALDDAEPAKCDAARCQLLKLGGGVVGDVLRSVTTLNRQIMALGVTDQYEVQCKYVDALAVRIALLGKLHAVDGLDAVLAALGDGANSAAYGSPASQRLVAVAGDALLALGEPAKRKVTALLGETRGPVHAALQSVLARF